MKRKRRMYSIQLSEEQMRIVGLAVEEYLRLRMGQFEDLADEFAFKDFDYKSKYDTHEFDKYIWNRSCIEAAFAQAAKIAWPPHGNPIKKPDCWGTCIDIWHAIEHQQWLDAPSDRKEEFGTSWRSCDQLSLGDEPFPKIERLDK